MAHSLLYLIIATVVIAIYGQQPRPVCLLGPFAFPLPIWDGVNGTGPACAPGFYCPNIDPLDNSTWPSVCPSTPECTVKRILGQECEPQGLYEPILCPPGYFCADWTKKEICPEGHYCPDGSIAPIECLFWSDCPEGSAQQRFYGALVYLISADLVIAAILFAYLISRQKKAKDHAKKPRMGAIGVMSAGSGEIQIEMASEINRRPVDILVDGFARSRGSSPPLDIYFDDLQLRLPKKNKTLLAGVTGHMRAGQVTAIMGPSGAGKTIFISTLMGKVDSSWQRGGTLQVNGVETSLTAIKSSIGYVPQEDIMHRDLTVWQNIRYAADVRLPQSWTREQRHEYCESILQVLNLEHVKYLRIGNEEKRGISGGQRKRVNIAMELAAAPLVLFLDEPTTGLDASSALEVCEILKRIASVTQINVAVVIHQPRVEIWNSLDHLLILAPGGRTVYLGPQRFAQYYFTRHLGVEFAPYENPADTLMDALSKSGQVFADKWREDGGAALDRIMADDATEEKIREAEDKDQSASAQSSDQSASSKSSSRSLSGPAPQHEHYGTNFDLKKVAARTGANFLTQMGLAHVRALKQQAVNYLSLLIEIGLSLLAGILIGLAATGSYDGIYISPYVLVSPASSELIIPLKGLFMNIAVGLAASAAGVRTFGDEKVIYWREAASGHNKASYFIGVALSQLYRIVFVALHFAGMAFLVGKAMSEFSRIFVICLGIYFAVYGLGAVISMVFDRKDAPLTAVVVTLAASLMSGFINVFPFGLKAISYAFWSSEAFYAGEVLPFERVFDIKSAGDIWDYDLNRYAMDIGIVFALGVGYRIVAFVLMIGLKREKQK